MMSLNPIPFCIEFAVADGRLVYTRFTNGKVYVSPLLADGEMVEADSVPDGLTWEPSGLASEKES